MSNLQPADPSRFTDILDSIPDALIVTDEAGRISRWNRSAETLYGWSSDEVLGKPIFDVTVPELSQEEAESIMSRLERGVPWSGYFRVQHRDGSQFLAYVRDIPQLGEDGHIRTILGLSERATDEVLFQETFEIAMRAGRLGVWEWDASTNRVSWSASLEAVYGLEPGTFSGRFEDMMERLHPDDREPAVNAIRGATEHRRELLFEHRIRLPHGEVRWLESRGEPIAGPAEVLGVRGVSIDITERKAVEERAANRERQQAAIADLGREALTGGDIQTLAERAVAATAEILGVEFARVLQANEDQTTFTVQAGVGWIPDIVGRPSSDDGLEHARYTLRVGQPVVIDELSTETRFTPPQVLLDHGIVSGISMVIRGRRRPWGVLGAHTTQQRKFAPDDIYFVRSMANVLGLAMDARAAAENRDAFISLVSHELRNPLTTIQGFASLLQRQTREDATFDESASLDFIVGASRRMGTTLQLLVDLARLDAGDFTVAMDDVDLTDLVAAEVQALLFRDPSVRVEVRTPDEPVTIRSDRDRIAQVLTNLLDNASKYGGGQIEVSVVRDTDGVSVQMKDNGQGIAATDLGHIFERFYRARSSVEDASTTGSGLGLYISQQVARRLGGRISCESTPGLGSLFTLSLPL